MLAACVWTCAPDTIDFRELALGVAKLVKGSKQEKLDLMFELCDDNGAKHNLELWCSTELIVHCR